MRRQPGFLGMFAGVATMAALALVAPSSASADFVVNIDSTYNGSAPVGTSPYLRATFQDTATPGTVRLTMENLMTASGGQQFVDTWLFNVDPTITSGITFNFVSGVGAVAPTPLFSPNAYGNNQGPGVSGLPKTGLFDIVFDFQSSNSPNASPPRFDGSSPTNVSVWDIIGPSTLTAASFNYLSTKDNVNDNRFLSVAHVQGIPLAGGGTTSGGLAAVPEPSSAALAGLGLAMAGVYGLNRRRRLQARG